MNILVKFQPDISILMIVGGGLTRYVLIDILGMPWSVDQTSSRKTKIPVTLISDLMNPFRYIPFYQSETCM
jgi:hypothetical protein